MTLQIINSTTFSDPTTGNNPVSGQNPDLQKVESELYDVIQQLADVEMSEIQGAGQGGPGFQNAGANAATSPATGGWGFAPVSGVSPQSQSAFGIPSGSVTSNVPSLASDLDISSKVHDALNACDYVKNPYDHLHTWDFQNAQGKLKDLQQVEGELQSRIAGAEAAGQPVSQQDKDTLASLQQDIATCQADISS
jgi:hypothetical protein